MDISALRAKLPDIRRWVDTTVDKYRHVARPVGSFGFPRLGQYFESETLNHAFVVEVDAIPKSPLTALGLHQFAEFEQMSADGITYRDIYFLDRARAADESLHFHELVHIVQWQVLGPDRFILAYALGHVTGGYSTNPFEQAAYELQDRFARQEKPFNVELIVKRHLGQIMPALLAAISP